MGLWKRVKRLLPLGLFAASAITLSLARPKLNQLMDRELESRVSWAERYNQGQERSGRERLTWWLLSGTALSLGALGAAHAVLRKKGQKKSFLQPAAENPGIASLVLGSSFGLAFYPQLVIKGDAPYAALMGSYIATMAYPFLLSMRALKPPYLSNYARFLRDIPYLLLTGKSPEKAEKRQAILERVRAYWKIPESIDVDIADVLFEQGKVDQGCDAIKRVMQAIPTKSSQESLAVKYLVRPMTHEVFLKRHGEKRPFTKMHQHLKMGDVSEAFAALDLFVAKDKTPSKYAARAYVAQSLADFWPVLQKILPLQQDISLENRAQQAWQDAITVILNDADREKRFKRLGESRNEVLEYAPNEFLKGLLIFKRCDEQDGSRLQRERENILASRVRFKNHVVQSLAYAAHEGKAYHVLRHGTSRTLEQTLLARNAQESIDALKHATAALALLHRNVLGPGANDASGEGYYTNRLQTVFANQLAARVELTSELRNELDKAGYRVHCELADAQRGWYKDANPRNWLVEDNGKVVAIDFEHRSLLPVQLDLVSLFEFGKASLNDNEREMMLEHYLRVLARKKPVDREHFRAQYDAAALQRHLELAGYRARDKEDVAVSWHLSRARRYAVKLGEYGLDDALKKLKLEA